MCSMRMRSSGRILHPGRADDLITKMPAQIVGRAEIDLPSSEHLRKLELHRRNRQQPGDMSGFEVNEQVDIAVRPCRALEQGAEHLESSNVMLLAKRSERLGLDGQQRFQMGISFGAVPNHVPKLNYSAVAPTAPNNPSPKCEPRPRTIGPPTTLEKVSRARHCKPPLGPSITWRIHTTGNGRPRREHSVLRSAISASRTSDRCRCRVGR